MNGLLKLALLAAFALASISSTQAADSFKIDPVHSSIHFKVQHFGAGFTIGRFDKIGGTMTLDGDKSAVSITAEADSIDTNEPKRDEHLKGADFFNAKEFPKINFTSTGVKKTGEKTYEISGEFALAGVKKSLTFTATQVGEAKGFKGERLVGFEAVFTINRLDYGVKYAPDKLGTDVVLTIEIEAIGQ